MKIIARIFAGFCSLLILSTLAPLLFFAPKISAASTNLIANPSFENADAADANVPAQWQKGGWGTNTRSYSYDATAHTGTKSAKVSITSYTNGDVKWYATPVSVTANTQYTFSDFYIANTTSYIVVQYGDSAGNFTYVELGITAAAASWQQYQVQFTTPSNAATVSVFHLLRSVGELSLDDYSVAINETTPAPTPTSGNLITNPSAETNSTAGVNTADGWSGNGWGTQTAAFSVVSDAHSGMRALKTIVTAYTSGDAKWHPAQVSVSGNTKYSFSDYYKSANESYVVAELDDGNGNFTYIDLGTAAASTAWKNFTADVTTAASTKKITMYHVLASVGDLTVDDYSLVAGTAAVQGNNLITNSSLETTAVGGTSPASWAKDSWGTNTPVYSYVASGHTGAKSAKVQITSYTSGDAKWYFTPVAVSAGAVYNFSDYYISDVMTQVVAEVDDGAGNMTYIDIGTAPTAPTWQQYQASFTTPAGAKKVTIFHVLGSVGNLTVDDYSLTTTQTTPPDPVPVATNLLANPSLETATGATPSGWIAGHWQSNLPTFTYSQTGHTGSRSVRIDMANYVSGGANWSYDGVAVTPGKTYAFSDYYQSNAFTQVIVAVKLANGSTSYLWLGNPYTSSGVWTKFSATFTAPSNAVSVSVYHVLAGNGYLQTDDYDLHEYTLSSFNQAMVSITFDDGIATQYSNALPIMSSYGMKGTFYIISGKLNTSCVSAAEICYMTSGNVKSIFDGGNEIGSHTVSHPDLTTLNSNEVTAELANSKDTLSAITGSPIFNLASPYGRVNADVLSTAQQYYSSHRGVEIGYNSKDNLNTQYLLVQDINSSTSVAQVQSYIDYAKAHNVWLILMYHDINTDGSVDPGYNTTPSDFAAHMAYLAGSGVQVVTVQAGLQLAASQM